MLTWDRNSLLDLQAHAGRWVIVAGDRVIGSGRTPLEARRASGRAPSPDKAGVAFFVANDRLHLQSALPLSPVLDCVREALTGHPDVEVYLVGGAVRDALLGRTSKDLDFAVHGPAVDLARAVADELGGAFYLLDAGRGTARVVLQSQPSIGAGQRVMLDFSVMRGKDLLEDLEDRDFTINAMALPAQLQSPTVEALIDPYHGQAHLTDRIIRAINDRSLQQDPLRTMRAVRLAAALDCQIDAQTIDQIEAAADLLPTVSPERIRDELIGMLSSPRPADSIRSLSQLQLLPHVLPELAATRGVEQSRPHSFDVFNHALCALEKLDQLLEGLLRYEAELDSYQKTAHNRLVLLTDQLRSHLFAPTAGGRTRQSVLYLAVLLHDAGKPSVRTVDGSGCISFLQHEHIGAELASKRARSLALSVNEIRMIRTAIRNHMRPAWLAPNPSGRAVYRFFRDTGQAGVDTCLLSLGDGLGRGGGLEPHEWLEWVGGVAVLLESYFNHNRESVSPPALLTGRELMEALQIPPGPEVGRLLELIREAQAAGEVRTSPGALLLAKEAHQAR
jgi:tRNA nucleotidyltransferase/poly(A) polymerase